MRNCIVRGRRRGKMKDIFDCFLKKKEYLVCVDSDGCAMDTMDSKHILCFGPCLIREWGLEAWQDEIQALWNQINLYTMTRGINRFKGLELALREIDRSWQKIPGLSELSAWTAAAPELSGAGLARYIQEEKPETEILKKTLSWSETVNQMVDRLPRQEKAPFKGAAEGLEELHRWADVAIVSSANEKAIMEEWKEWGLLRHTDIVMSQDAGSKAYCIGRLLGKGYKKEHVLMVGDAPGDRDAAALNGVLYYPILVKKEEASWERLRSQGLRLFVNGSYKGEYQDARLDEFEENLTPSSH